MIHLAVLPASLVLLLPRSSVLAQQAADRRPSSWAPIGCNDLHCPGFSGNVGATLASFGGWLFAATLNLEGTQIWRHDGTTTWTRLLTPISTDNKSILDPTEYQGKLYLGTFNEETGCEVWRHDLNTFERIDPGGGFGTPDHEEVSGMGTFNGLLFVGTADEQVAARAEVWTYDAFATIAPWNQVTPPWSQDVFEASGFVEYQGRLYVGASRAGGCEIWRCDGANWELVRGNGFGFGGSQRDARALAVHANRLYVGTENDFGCQVWGYDGTDWTRVGGPPPANRNEEVTCLISFGGSLYAGTEGFPHRPAGVWRYDGSSWLETSSPGFDVPGTFLVWSMVEHRGVLHAATMNDWVGARVWRH